MGHVFMVVSLKGTIILSAVKENATMKWTFGTQADTIQAGRSGLFSLAGFSSIVESTKIFLLHPKTQLPSWPTVGLLPPVSLQLRLPLVGEQTEINGAKLRL